MSQETEITIREKTPHKVDELKNLPRSVSHAGHITTRLELPANYITDLHIPNKDSTSAYFTQSFGNLILSFYKGEDVQAFLNCVDGFTLAFWFRVNSLLNDRLKNSSNSRANILHIEFVSNTNTKHSNVSLQLFIQRETSSIYLKVNSYNQSLGFQESSYLIFKQRDENWHHVVLQYNPHLSQWYLFIDYRLAHQFSLVSIGETLRMRYFHLIGKGFYTCAIQLWNSVPDFSLLRKLSRYQPSRQELSEMQGYWNTISDVSSDASSPDDVSFRCIDATGNANHLESTDTNKSQREEYDIRVWNMDLDTAISMESGIFFIEEYRLTTFAGDLGKGQIIRTLSLMPGETTKITIKSFTHIKTNKKEEKSILDSAEDEHTNTFKEDLNKAQERTDNRDFKFSADLKFSASADWGVYSANLDADVNTSLGTQHNEFARNMNNVVKEHAAKASSKREIHINTTSETEESEDKENEIVREISNINVSRTLNFEFYQLTQEMISILHLIDVKVGFFDGLSSRIVPLSLAKKLIEEVIEKTNQETVLNNIARHLRSGINPINPHQRSVLSDNNGYELGDGDGHPLQFGTIHSAYDPEESDDNPIIYGDHKLIAKADGRLAVPGIITHITRNVMLTDQLVADATLGAGEALDDYSKGLQEEEITKLRLANERQQLENERERLRQSIIESCNTTKADLYKLLYPQPIPQLKYVTAETAYPNGDKE